jgi:L-amino acid N-acyltransferase YncA
MSGVNDSAMGLSVVREKFNWVTAGGQCRAVFLYTVSYTLCRYGSGQGDKLADFVLPIASRTYAEWVDPQSAWGWAIAEHGAHVWSARLDDASTHVLVCERPDASMAACAFVRIRETTAFFGGLYVADVARGLGTLLRDERLRISREAGARTAVMLIRETNRPARILATKAGFEMVGEDPCTSLTAVPRLVYEKPLEASRLVPI